MDYRTLYDTNHMAQFTAELVAQFTTESVAHFEWNIHLWRDYRKGYQQKEMTLEATEFLRRFCQHILPYRFTKIRHYGILSNRNKNKLREIQFLMGIIVDKKEKKSWQEISKEKLHFDPGVCSHCGIGHFITISSWNGRAPPKRFVQNKGI